MKKFIIYILFLFASHDLQAQARLVIGNASGIYVKLNGGTAATPIYLVVANSATNGITRNNGWIISESQYNYVKWSSTNTGSYLIPFGYTTTDYIPFTFGKTSAGASDLIVSTWNTGSNNVPWALATNVAAVANMNISNGTDGSIPDVIDRWWTINTTATANLTFTYRGQENTMTTPGNILAVQHWDGTKWNDGNGNATGTFINTGTAGSNVAGPHTVTGVSTFNQFSPYVLVDKNSPLPVEWLNISADCNNGDATIKWSTASEMNSNYFTVEKSLDGINFSGIQTVQAAGNSSDVNNYSAVDHDAYSGTSYYRVKETDFNGDFNLSSTVIINWCSSDNVNVYGSEGTVNVNIDADEDGQYLIEIYDLLGQKLLAENENVSAGNNQFKLTPEISTSIYLVKVISKNNITTKKIFIK